MKHSKKHAHAALERVKHGRKHHGGRKHGGRKRGHRTVKF